MSDRVADRLAALAAADEAFARVMTGVAEQIETMPPDLEPADALRWAGDRVTELLAGWATLPLERMLGLEDEAPAGSEVGAGEPVTATAAPGAVLETRVWVHPAGAPAGELRFRLTDLVAATGASLPAGEAVFAPAVLTLPTAGSTAVLLRLPVPPDSRAGTYHGHVLAAGAGEAAVPVAVVVR